MSKQSELLCGYGGSHQVAPCVRGYRSPAPEVSRQACAMLCGQST